MSLLTRYIGRQLLFTALSVITVLTCVVWLAQSIKFVELVANKGVSLQHFLELIFFLLPNLIIIVIPIAVLTAVLFIYNKLITDHELIVLQSSGFSRWQLAKPALLVALFFTAIMYGFNLYVLPISSQNFRDLEHAIKNAKSIHVLRAGQFNSVGKYTVYLREKLSNNDFMGALIYDMKEPDNPVTHMAEYGTIMDDGDSSRLFLVNGNTQRKDPKTGKINVLYFDQYTLETAGSKKDRVRKIKPHELFLSELLEPDPEVIKGAKLNFYYSEAHQRIISPFYCVVFTIFALSMLILTPYNRRGRSKQVVAVALMSCAFYVISLVLLNMQKSLGLSVAILYTLVGAVILIGLYLFSDMRLFASGRGKAS